jgi:hypothetical protein
MVVAVADGLMADDIRLIGQKVSSKRDQETAFKIAMCAVLCAVFAPCAPKGMGLN